MSFMVIRSTFLTVIVNLCRMKKFRLLYGLFSTRLRSKAMDIHVRLGVWWQSVVRIHDQLAHGAEGGGKKKRAEVG